MTKKLAIIATAFVLSACAGPQVTRVQALTDTADAPYKNVLVVSLFELFDTRRWLEEALVEELKAQGISAVASTSMMNTKTPVTRGMMDVSGSRFIVPSVTPFSLRCCHITLSPVDQRTRGSAPAMQQ